MAQESEAPANEKGPRRGPSVNILSTLRSQQAPEPGKHVPEMGLEPAAPPQIRHSFENLPDPAQSDAGTTESEAQGVHIVHTLFCQYAEPQPSDDGRSFWAL